MGQSPAHKHLFVSDLEWLISPPMMLGQLRILYARERAVACALWASVSDAVDQELAHGRTRLKPDEWKSGDKLWLIELIAPSFISDADQEKKLLSAVAREVFAGKPFKMLRLNPETRMPETVEVSANLKDRGNAEARVKA